MEKNFENCSVEFFFDLNEPAGMHCSRECPLHGLVWAVLVGGPWTDSGNCVMHYVTE